MFQRAGASKCEREVCCCVISSFAIADLAKLARLSTSFHLAPDSIRRVGYAGAMRGLRKQHGTYRGNSVAAVSSKKRSLRGSDLGGKLVRVLKPTLSCFECLLSEKIVCPRVQEFNKLQITLNHLSA